MGEEGVGAPQARVVFRRWATEMNLDLDLDGSDAIIGAWAAPSQEASIHHLQVVDRYDAVGLGQVLRRYPRMSIQGLLVLFLEATRSRMVGDTAEETQKSLRWLQVSSPRP